MTRARLRFLVISVAAILGMAATLSLARWQLSRAAEKEALQAAIDEQGRAAPLDGRSLAGLKSLAPLLHRPIALRGSWVPSATVYLDNRQMNARPGFYVVTPLRVDGSGTVVLVQRGWIPRNFEDRARLVAIETPPGTVDVTGRIEAAPSHLLELGGAQAPAGEGSSRIRQNLDLAAFRAETGLDVPDGSVVQTGSPSEGLLREWPQVATGVEKHYGYAFQWFGLAALIAFLYVWFQFIAPAGAMPGATDEPLGLTVHSMPSPAALAGGAQRTVSGRMKMIAVMLVCAAPVIASYFTYYVVRPEGSAGYGELIQPLRSIPALAATDLQGRRVDLAALKDQWLLVTVAPAACGPACENNLYLQRQLRETLGREKDRLDRVWLVVDDAPVAPALLPALRGAAVLRVPRAAVSQWLQPAAGHALEDHLYVVDPMGNWMMRFPANMDRGGAARAKRDLDRLLRASASWDTAGRPGQPAE